MLLEDKLGEEESLVDSRAASDTIDVVFVELVRLLRHQLDLIINYPINITQFYKQMKDGRGNA